MSSKGVYTPTEITNRISESRDLKLLYSESSKKLSKILSSADMQSLFWMYDHLGLPVPVILMIVDYSVSNNKPNMRYIEKIAIDWADNNITSIEQAETHLSYLESKKTFEAHIKKIFGITGRALTPAEKKIVSEWEENKIDDDTLVSAFEINIERTSKLSLRYINGIIKNWNEQKSKKTINKKHRNFTERPDIDFDAREIEILKKQMGE